MSDGDVDSGGFFSGGRRRRREEVPAEPDPVEGADAIESAMPDDDDEASTGAESPAAEHEEAPEEPEVPDAPTAPWAAPSPVTVQSESLYEVIDGITTPRSQFRNWDAILKIIREAYVKAGGAVTRKNDPLRGKDEFYGLVSRTHDTDRDMAKLVETGDNLGQLSELLRAELFHLGVLGQYLEIDGLEDINLNGHERMMVTVRGRKVRVESPYATESAAMNFLTNVFALLGDKPLNDENPVQSGVLPDANASRIQAIIPPVSLIGPCFSIRKHTGSVIPLEQYIEWGTFSAEFWEDVKTWVQAGLHVFVSGGTSTGKTSLLRVLIGEIPERDRILLIEETPEIDVSHRPDIISLMPVGMASRNKGGTVDYRDLVAAALRMKPDRIIFGETRGAETWELLDALNTGHGGSMATVHANNPQQALKRLATLAGMAFGAGADEQQFAIWDAIATNVNIVIQIKREVVRNTTTGEEREHRFVSEVWQFGEETMFDTTDPDVLKAIAELRSSGRMRQIRQGQVIGWPLWQRRPQTHDGQLVRVTEFIPLNG